jgi:filamentous hemagglutinin family protein
MSTNLRLKYLALLMMSIFCQAAQSNPTGGTSATATFNTIGNQHDVTTNATSSIINWTSFSISSGQTTNIYQPTSASISLNRVTGTAPSVIAGTLYSNGKVILVNQNGIVFKSNSTINVGSLIASTLNITDADFLTGSNVFAGASSAEVSNAATIQVASGGMVALIGARVTNENSGIIRAPDGQVWLLAGRGVAVTSLGTPEISTTVSAPAGEALNLGTIVSQGGVVALIGDTVKNNGLISANIVASTGGRIILHSRRDLAVGTDATIEARGGSIILDAQNGHVRLRKRGLIDASDGTIDINGLTIIQDSGSGTSIKAAWLRTKAMKRGVRLNRSQNSIIRFSPESENDDGSVEKTKPEEISIPELPLAHLIPPRIPGIAASNPIPTLDITQPREPAPAPVASSSPSNIGSSNVDKTPMRNRFVCSA